MSRIKGMALIEDETIVVCFNWKDKEGMPWLWEGGKSCADWTATIKW